MTDQATRVVSAGWYQDPASSEQVRWWNGVAWTEHVREKPVAAQASLTQDVTGSTTATATVAAETAAQRLAAAHDLERQFGIGIDENPVIPINRAATTTALARVTTATTTDLAARRAADHRAAGHASTASAWLIALSPLLALALGIVAAYIYFYVVATPIVFVIAVAVPFLLCLLWALADRRTLKDRGFRPRSGAFALLTGLGYLIARRSRIPGSGPIAMLLVVGALAFGAIPVASLTGQTQGITSALNIQRTISADYLSTGKAVQVNCPPFVDATTIGTLYTCDATLATGVHKTIWVSIDGENGKFSYSIGL
ncbi:MAG: DUF2510 domain-containing protein [Pseudolysinimonas sp.]